MQSVNQKPELVTNMIKEAEKYTLVGIDIDATGRRLINEIVQLSAYNPKSQYSQYIMPYMNLNAAARQRHQLRVVTIGYYRMLQCTRTNKIVKSKSEIASLNDFLDWLHVLVKTDPNSSGVILIYHEERKFVPYMIIEAIKRYNLTERFLTIVKAFANGYEFAKLKCSGNLKIYSIRRLSKTLLNKNEIIYHSNYRNSPKQSRNGKKLYFEGCASVRAKLAFEIYQYLAVSNCPGGERNLQKHNVSDDDINGILEFNVNALQAMLKYIVDIAKPITDDFNELDKEKKSLDRQNSFRPVFLRYFEAALYHRVRAVKFRIILSESGYDYENLKAIWTEKRREGLTEVIQTIPLLKNAEKDELINLLDAHYDPTKPPMQPPARKHKSHHRKFKDKRNLKISDARLNHSKENKRNTKENEELLTSPQV
ncbi:maternal protein exuperantia-1 [Condylostylus longicornis]|uniref:maternal protein exuperantia-1 n=1 Tax=Condylostylus longicornis TaxID=2530218 RepID=UPI00244E38B6|nr:maternal protein exuperantia-1 [Condylostylus longicornis]